MCIGNEATNRNSSNKLIQSKTQWHTMDPWLQSCKLSILFIELLWNYENFINKESNMMYIHTFICTYVHINICTYV